MRGSRSYRRSPARRGGGCELLLHSDAIQAHANSFPGLVEPAVGLVPAWGVARKC